MTKYPGQPKVTIEQDHRFLVAVLTDIRNELRDAGQVLAGDRLIFQEDGSSRLDADMPTLLELLDGYIAERT